MASKRARRKLENSPTASRNVRRRSERIPTNSTPSGKIDSTASRKKDAPVASIPDAPEAATTQTVAKKKEVAAMRQVVGDDEDDGEEEEQEPKGTKTTGLVGEREEGEESVDTGNDEDNDDEDNGDEPYINHSDDDESLADVDNKSTINQIDVVAIEAVETEIVEDSEGEEVKVAKAVVDKEKKTEDLGGKTIKQVYIDARATHAEVVKLLKKDSSGKWHHQFLQSIIALCGYFGEARTDVAIWKLHKTYEIPSSCNFSDVIKSEAITSGTIIPETFTKVTLEVHRNSVKQSLGKYDKYLFIQVKDFNVAPTVHADRTFQPGDCLGYLRGWPIFTAAVAREGKPARKEYEDKLRNDAKYVWVRDRHYVWTIHRLNIVSNHVRPMHMGLQYITHSVKKANVHIEEDGRVVARQRLNVTNKLIGSLPLVANPKNKV